MHIKSIRILIFSIAFTILATSCFLRFYITDIIFKEPLPIDLIIFSLCLIFGGISFLKYIKKRPLLLLYSFNTLISLCFILLTAFNNFLPDYSYFLVFIILILSLMFPNSFHFAIYYSICLIFLFVLALIIEQPLIKPHIFITLFIISGIVLYFILLSKEKMEKKMELIKINANAILYNSYGMFFFIGKDYRIIAFNKNAEQNFYKGFSKQIKTGKLIFDYIPNENKAHLKNTLDLCINGETVKNEKEITITNNLTMWTENIFVPVYDQSKKFLGISFQILDITERKKTEKEIKENEIAIKFSNTLLLTQLESSIDGILAVDENGKFIMYNKRFIEIWEIPEEIANSNSDNAALLFVTSKLSKPNEFIEKVKYLYANKTEKSIDEIILINGKVLERYSSPLISDKNEYFGRIWFFRDISERKNFEKALVLSEERFKEMANTLPLLVYETDIKSNIIYFNDVAYNYTGYNQEDFEKGLSLIQLIVPEEQHKAIENAKKIMKGKTIKASEFTLQKKDGTRFPVIISTLPIIRNGKVIGRRGVVTDISDVKKAEEKIRTSLKEKEILLSEIHHRVKNNLQVIISMLNLQSHNITDERILEVFREAQNRITTMGLVHQKLYKTDNFSMINIQNYLYDLVDIISSSFNSVPEKINITFDVKTYYINIDTMIPLGLIINEIISNSLKHAFPDNKTGIINIIFKKINNDTFQLSIIDNGIGINKNIDIENSSTLGLSLVKALSSQLNGEFELKSDNGCNFIFTFKETVSKNNL